MNAYDGAMVTVTSVRMSPDLALGRARISVFPSDKAHDVLESLQKQNKVIRGELGRRVAKQLRIVPELIFQIDDSLDYVERIDELLSK